MIETRVAGFEETVDARLNGLVFDRVGSLVLVMTRTKISVIGFRTSQNTDHCILTRFLASEVENEQNEEDEMMGEKKDAFN